MQNAFLISAEHQSAMPEVVIETREPVPKISAYIEDKIGEMCSLKYVLEDDFDP